MLDLVYIALVAAPLGIAAAAMLVLALKSLRSHQAERVASHEAAVARAEASPGGLRRRAEPLAEPPSIATVHDISTLARRPSVADLSDLVASLAGEFSASPAAGATGGPRNPPPPPAPAQIVSGTSGAPTAGLGVGAGPVALKRCPDCAEEVLAAARVCKHCRYRWDEPEDAARVRAG